MAKYPLNMCLADDTGVLWGCLVPYCWGSRRVWVLECLASMRRLVKGMSARRDGDVMWLDIAHSGSRR